MAKDKEIIINRFDAGITDEQRDATPPYFWYMENLTVGKDFRSAKQVPNIETAINDKFIRSFIVIGGTTWGLGANTGKTAVSLYSATPSAGGGIPFTLATNATSTGYDFPTTSNTDMKPLFARYFDGTITILYYTTDTTIGRYIADTEVNQPNLATLPVAGGMNGTADWQGKYYGWIANDIYSYDPTDYTTAPASKITISADQRIKQLVPYGNYLLIICAGDGNYNTISKMYVWDGVTTTTFADIVNIGYGRVVGGDVLDGLVYVVMGFPNNKGFTVKEYAGNSFRTVKTYTGKRNTVINITRAFPCSLVKTYTGFLYFLARITKPGSALNTSPYEEMVLFRYGRKNETKPNALSVYKTLDMTPASSYDPSNDTNHDFAVSEYAYTPANETALSVSDFVVASIVEASSTARIVTTASSSFNAVYSAQAGVAETCIITGGDPTKDKELKVVSVQFAPLPSGGQIDLQYKKDEQTTWTTILTETTGSAIAHTAVNIESTGANLPQWKEIAFRVSALGGAEPTGIKIRYEELFGLYE